MRCNISLKHGRKICAGEDAVVSGNGYAVLRYTGVMSDPVKSKGTKNKSQKRKKNTKRKGRK